MALEILGTGDSWDLGDLATKMAAREQDGQPSSQERKTTYVSLYQTHIPTLVEHDVVEWDKQSNTVVPSPIVDELAAIHAAAKAVREGDLDARSLSTSYNSRCGSEVD